MKQFVTFLLSLAIVALFSISSMAQQRFDRVAEIQGEPLDVGGIGALATGDLDGDGKVEIYAVNNNWKDSLGEDLIPRIYKYERNDSGDWVIVWWTRLPFDLQNTWPPLVVTDLDNDGRGEITWGPINFLNADNNPNPSRIVVFETPGDGSDGMGIDNGDGTWSPNAQWNMDIADNSELRPFRFIIDDIDGDGVDEIMTIMRRTSTGQEVVQVFSVDTIPDDGNGLETWTREFMGGGDSRHWDIAYMPSLKRIVAIAQSGNVTSITYSAGAYTTGATQAGLVTGGSWKSASTVDLDGDGTEEIVVASWLNNDKLVWLLQYDAAGDSLTATEIANFTKYTQIRRLNGGAWGDVDGDGNPDFIFGTRDFDSTPDNPTGNRTNAVVRVEYQGGAIDDPGSYEASLIDRGVIFPQGSQIDVIHVADLNGDGEDEVVFSGTTRPFGSGPPILPVSILSRIPANQPKIATIQDVPNDNGGQVWVTWQGSADDVGGMRFTADLIGMDAGGAPVATPALGKATFTLDKDAGKLWYMLEVYNIDSISQAHIHIGPPDGGGPVGAFLFGPTAGGGPVNGVLSRGVVAVGDLVGPVAGDWAAFESNLLTGNTYVVVHTTTHPGGEIRGQVLTDGLTGTAAAKVSGFTISHYVVWRIDNGAPNQVARVDAIQAKRYAAVVPTLGNGEDWTGKYVVSAHTPRVDVLWKSIARSGTSEDNLVPTAPGNLVAKLTEASDQGPFVELTWDESPDVDFNYFEIYRGTVPGFDPDAVGPAGQSTDPAFKDAVEALNPGEAFYYRIVAFDFNGNRGEFSEEVNTIFTAVGESPSGLPTAFDLRQNYPNPFNPATKIEYDVPNQANVSIVIFNIMGQKVRELVNEQKAAGSYTIVWDARDSNGLKVSTGVYMYIMRAGDFTQRKRMTLLK